MMVVIPKWRVTVTFTGKPSQVFWISDPHIGNVLRQVAMMDFSENGLEQPSQIVIGEPAERRE